MNKEAHENKGDGGPSVFRFQARPVRHPKAAKGGSLTLLNVPKVVSKKLRGMTKVEGTMNGHPFRAALKPNPSGGHWLRVNKAMREGAGADAGDTVKLAILGPEPEPTVPADLRVALTASHKAMTLWKDLTPIGRRDWIRWIDSAKRPETRARRVTRTVEQLSSGKRRPCCVNVYEFMLCRVQE
ncbi:MAG: YdeI/OmpD-associated family protein [Candidatus Acidiferrales bacterium]